MEKQPKETTKTVYLSRRGKTELNRSMKRLGRNRKAIINSLHEKDKTHTYDSRMDTIERLDELDRVETEIKRKHWLLRIAKPFPKQKGLVPRVQMGSDLEISDKYGHRQALKIVDSPEADPASGRVSINSPMGQALVGRKPFDIVNWLYVRGRQIQLMHIS